MSTDITLVQAYLENIQIALQNKDVPHAQILVESAQRLLTPQSTPPPLHSPLHISVGIGLDAGIKRQGSPNEDVAFATTGINIQTQETYGLFIVADGMGGHANGRLASRLGVETMVNTILPRLHHEYMPSSEAGEVLVDAVTRANAAIFQQSGALTPAHASGLMGTTVTAVITMGPHAFIANVGDSRTYLYRPGTGLRAVTRDHSVVARLVAEGRIAPEAIYTHPERHKIVRCLGNAPTIEVDLFYELLEHSDIVLCCSDGVWEMVRDPYIERILSSPWQSAEQMARRLLHAARGGGGLDNIGLVVSQFHMDLSAMKTVCITREAIESLLAESFSGQIPADVSKRFSIPIRQPVPK